MRLSGLSSGDLRTADDRDRQTLYPAQTAGERVIALNGSGRAPRSVGTHAKPWSGGSSAARDQAVTMPGAVDAFRLSADWGRYDHRQILAPLSTMPTKGCRSRRVLRWIGPMMQPPCGSRRISIWCKVNRRVWAGVSCAGAGAGASASPPRPRRFYEGEVAEDIIASLNALAAAIRWIWRDGLHLPTRFQALTGLS